MELKFWGIIIAIILFLIGLKVAKWILWGLAIILILAAGYIWIF